MSKQITVKNIVYFTDATDDTYFTSNVSTFSSAVVNIKITTTDANVNITTQETITQANVGVDPTCVFVTTIKSNDPNLIADVNNIISSTEVQVNNTGDETVTDDGYHITAITSIVTKPNATEHVFADSAVSNVIDTTNQIKFRYLILRHNLVDGLLHGNPGGDDSMTCQEVYSVFNFACMKLSEGIYQTLKPNWGKEKIIEIDEDTAYYGCTFFGEIRPVAKLWEAKTSYYGEKVPTEITPEIIEKILTVMKAFATEIIYGEYDRRYAVLHGANDLEIASWEIQKHEAREWLANLGENGSKTPFLDYLAEEKGKSKTDLANSILIKAEEYEDNLSTMLVEMQKLLKQFNKCTTVRDINTLYEDYFGISMPVKQAIEMGRTVSADNWERLPQWRIKGNGYYF